MKTFPGHFLLRVSEGCRRQPPEAHGHSSILPPVAPLRKCTQTPTDDFTRTSGVGSGGGGLGPIVQGREGGFTSRGEASPNESTVFDLVFVLSCLKTSPRTRT